MNEQDKHRQTLEGIIEGAWRIMQIKPGARYRVRTGGDMLGNRATIDWYVPVQNSTALARTKRAYEEKLVRRCLGIYQDKPENQPQLRITEWDATQDNNIHIPGSRILWQAEDSLGARKHMMELFIQSCKELN